MLKGFSAQSFKWIFILLAAACFLAVLPLPIGYYTFLRFITTLGALLAIFLIYQHKNKASIFIFFIIAILFNPVVPIYLQKKSIWIPLDILTGCAFLYLAFLKNIQTSAEEPVSKTSPSTTGKALMRDIIIKNKEIN